MSSPDSSPNRCRSCCSGVPAWRMRGPGPADADRVRRAGSPWPAAARRRRSAGGSGRRRGPTDGASAGPRTRPRPAAARSAAGAPPASPAPRPGADRPPPASRSPHEDRRPGRSGVHGVLVQTAQGVRDQPAGQEAARPGEEARHPAEPREGQGARRRAPQAGGTGGQEGGARGQGGGGQGHRAEEGRRRNPRAERCPLPRNLRRWPPLPTDSGRPILVAVAWPYANGSQHLGHIAGAYLPADIFARYHRRRGNDVLMVSGSDAHGTPITVRADQEGVEPGEIVERFHPEFLRQWDELGISFDLFTSTRTDNHRRVSQDIFTRLRERGYVDIQTSEQMFDPEAQRFLPDRYVEGTCPHCGYPQARGDQCENCGRTLDPVDLIDPRSRVSGATPELRETQHFFLLLSKLEPELLAWLESRVGWRRHVINWSLQFVKDGLIDRAISRDLDLGRPAPHRRARRGQAHLRVVRGGDRLPVRQRRVGRASAATPRHGATGGRTTRRSPTTSWARTTSRSTRSSGRPSCSATATSTCRPTCRPTSTSRSRARRPRSRPAWGARCSSTSRSSSPTRCATPSPASCPSRTTRS